MTKVYTDTKVCICHEILCSGQEFMHPITESFSSDTVCDLIIPNGNLSSICGNRVDDTCDNFTCDYGYRKTSDVDAINCTETGEWSKNVSLLCIGRHCKQNILVQLSLT